METFKQKTIDILARYNPNTPMPILRTAAEEIELLHKEYNVRLSKHDVNMLDMVGE